jgi:hypothetical protein
VLPVREVRSPDIENPEVMIFENHHGTAWPENSWRFCFFYSIHNLNSSAVVTCRMPCRIVRTLIAVASANEDFILGTMVSMNRTISSVVGGVDRTFGFLCQTMFVSIDGKPLCHL